jgi:hypothetical protein
MEGLDDRVGVFLGAHRGADKRPCMRIDVELEIEGEAPAVDDDRHLHAVADPLGAWEEGAEGAAQRSLIGRPPAATGSSAQTMGIEDARHCCLSRYSTA